MTIPHLKPKLWIRTYNGFAVIPDLSSGVPSEEAGEAVPPLTSRPSDALIFFKQKIHVHTLLLIFHEGKY